MSRNYFSIAFTDPVMSAQARYGSRTALDRLQRHLHCPDTPDQLDDPPTAGAAAATQDPLGSAEREFVSEQDGFYLATVSESGWPYVQFRGGPRGFVQSPDAHTLAWADLRGNRQYISTGNLGYAGRVALIFMDYAHQRRLKVFGTATVSDVQGEVPYSGALPTPPPPARVEREVRVAVRAFDWNCPQHINPRYSAEEIEGVLKPLRRRVSDLQEENARLRRELHRSGRAQDATTNGSSAAPREEES